MNESTAPALEQEVASLKALQDILHNRIKQKKGEIHESHSKVYNDNLWRGIETLHWCWRRY
jgi:hypothetical protein